MRIFEKFYRFLYKDKLNVLKTLYINFALFDFKTAIKLPIIIKGPCVINSLDNASVMFTHDIYKGMLTFGDSHHFRSLKETTFIQINGILKCGKNVKIRRGTSLQISSSGTLTIGDDVLISDNNSISVFSETSIGSNTVLGNNVTLMDTDFHFVINRRTNEIHNMIEDVEIGANNWIGSFNVVKKGAKTPEGLILAGPFSMISRDYKKDIRPYSLLAGCPAVLKKEEFQLVTDEMVEMYVYKILATSGEKTVIIPDYLINKEQ